MKRTRINPINRTRRAKTFARNYGPESDAVRAMPCLCMDQDAGAFFYELEIAHTHGVPDAIVLCSGDTEAAHAVPRGMGGANSDKYKIAPLCHAHHEEAGEARTSKRAAFELRYGLDLIAEADRVAASHAPPLGIRGLAQRWAQGAASFDAADLDGWERPEELLSYETEALLGWVRRECERDAERRETACSRAHERSDSVVCVYDVHERPPCNACGHDGREPDDREALAAHVAEALGLDAALAEQLLDAAEVGHE